MNALIRCLLLAVFSAVTAEFLLGDQWLSGTAPLSGQIGQLLLFVCFYGSAAILIREVARRTGRGWPTILLLAFAFGVIEEGIVDQTLFNPDYLGLRLLDYGFIPGIGIGGPWTIFVLTLHVIWSMGAPIALAEALFPQVLPRRRAVSPQVQAPWLGWAIVVPICLYVLGAAAIFTFSATAGFVAAWWQMLAAAAVAAAAIVVALRLRPAAPRAPRSPWSGVLIGLVFSGAFQLADQFVPKSVSPWIASGIMLVILALGALVVLRLRPDPFGLGCGAVLTYCVLGLTTAFATSIFALIEQAVLVLAAIATMGVILRRYRRPVAAAPGSPPAGETL